MNWWNVLEGAVVSWPPVIIGCWLGKRKLRSETDRQTQAIQTLTSSQTDEIRTITEDQTRKLTAP